MFWGLCVCLAIFSCENQDSGPEFPQVLSCVLDALQVGLQRATELIDELIKRPDVTCKQVAVTHVSRVSGTKNICKCCTAGGGGLTIITIHISSGLIKPQFTTRPPPNVITSGVDATQNGSFSSPSTGLKDPEGPQMCLTNSVTNSQAKTLKLAGLNRCILVS